MHELLRETEKQTKPQGGERGAEDEGPMARESPAVELPGHSIVLPALAGEAELLAARRDEETHQVAARPVGLLAARTLQAARKRMALPAWLRLAAGGLPPEQVPPEGAARTAGQVGA